MSAAQSTTVHDGLLHPHFRHCSSAASAVRRLPSAVRTATPAFNVRPSSFFCNRPGTRYQTTCEIRHVPLTVFAGTWKLIFSRYYRTQRIGGFAIMRYISLLLTLTLTMNVSYTGSTCSAQFESCEQAVTDCDSNCHCLITLDCSSQMQFYLPFPHHIGLTIGATAPWDASPTTLPLFSYSGRTPRIIQTVYRIPILLSIICFLRFGFSRFHFFSFRFSVLVD